MPTQNQSWTPDNYKPDAPAQGSSPAGTNGGGSVSGVFVYMAPSVPRSLTRTGKVGARRDLTGATVDSFGVVPRQKRVAVRDARGCAAGLRDEGYQLVPHPLRHIDYYDNQRVLTEYYPECCRLVQRITGAAHVFAFDHNIRSTSGKEQGRKLSGGNDVQGPAHVVHNDYTVTSAPDRLAQLARPPAANDTLRPLLGDRPLIDPRLAERAAGPGGRFAIINVWRNIRTEPVESLPLALCDGASMDPKDLVTFQIDYVDRVGENYFAAHAPGHRWSYYPRLTRDEALLLKQWDSAGGLPALHNGGDPAGAPSTFSLHSAFADPTTPAGAPDRESIEVRTVAIFEDGAAKL